MVRGLPPKNEEPWFINCDVKAVNRLAISNQTVATISARSGCCDEIVRHRNRGFYALNRGASLRFRRPVDASAPALVRVML